MIQSPNIPTQAVILAAGRSSRFEPFANRKSHKSLFELMGEPIIFKTIASLKSSGIKQILIIHSPEDQEIVSRIKQEFESTINLSFHAQSKPIGMGNALLEAKSQLQERFLVVNPQQINIASHLEKLNSQTSEDRAEKIFLFSQTTEFPEKYGMLKLDSQRVLGLTEKPNDLTGLSDQRILGIYILNLDFINFMATIETQEYQLESALDTYAQTHKVIALRSDEPALTLKYAWDLFDLANYQFSTFNPNPVIKDGAVIHPTAIITGAVVIEAGAQIHEYALIQGPAYIGNGTVVGSYCKVRAETVLEANVTLQNQAEVKHSILGKGTSLHSGFIGDSIIGTNVKIGAGFITANRRFDRRTIRVPIKSEMIDSSKTYLGCLIGDDVSIGIHCSSNPGTIVNSAKVIQPMTMITNPKL